MTKLIFPNSAPPGQESQKCPKNSATDLGAVWRKKSGQKSDMSDSAETPPLVKSDTFLKNIFIAFLNSTAFVCYLEMNLFFPPLKTSEEKTLIFSRTLYPRGIENLFKFRPPYL